MAGLLSAGMDPNKAYEIAQQQGLSVDQVAQQTGWSAGDINQWLSNNQKQAPAVASSATYQPPEPTQWQARPGGNDQITATSDPFEDYKIAMRNGLSAGEIASRKGVGVNDVYKWVKDNKLPWNTGGGFLNGVIDNLNKSGVGIENGWAAIAQAARGKSIKEIALETGYSEQEIADYMQRHSLTPGDIPEYYSGLNSIGAGSGAAGAGGAGSGGGVGGSGSTGGAGGAGGGYGGNYGNGAYADPNTAGYNSPMARDQLSFMLNQDTPYMQAARTAGLQHGASRGLLNSSLSAEAAQKAMVEAAGPIAQQDADFWQSLNKMETEFQNNLKLDTNKEMFATARAEYQADQQMRSDYLKSISNINAQDLNPEDKRAAVEHMAELYRNSGVRGVMDRVEIGSDGAVTFKQGDTSIKVDSSAGGAKAASNDWTDYDKKADMPASLRLEYENRYGTYYEPAQVRWLMGAGADIAYKLGNMNYQSVPYSQYQPPANPVPGTEQTQSQYTGQVFTGKDAAYARVAFDDEFKKRAKERGITLNQAELQKLFGWASIAPPPVSDVGAGP